MEQIAQQQAGLFGNPIKHSLSPAMQNAAYVHYKLPVRFSLWEIAPDELAERVARLRDEEYLGATLTVPFKRQVIPYLDELDEHAQEIGAVNTISKNGTRLIGHNTDGEGFLRSLTDTAHFTPRGTTITIAGAGGAARAVAFGLLGAGVKRLQLLNRGQETLTTLAAELAGRTTNTQEIVTANLANEEEVKRLLASSDLLINATSFGLHPGEMIVNPDMLPQSALVYDLMYRQTDLQRIAREKGYTTLDGLAMLVHVNALCFGHLTGRPAPIEVMWEAAEKARTSAP